MAAARNRFRFSFWLDANNDRELLIAETIDELKRQRSFVSTIRDGIMLMTELRQGKTDMLLRLFPWLTDALKPPTNDAGGGGDLLRRLEEKLDSLALPSGGNGYLMAPPAKLRATTGETLPDLELPAGSIFVAASIQEKKASAGEARAAFTGGMGDLFGGDDDDLWDD